MHRFLQFSLLAAVVSSPLLSADAEAPPRLRVETIVPQLDGSVGGIAVDTLGFLYVADFGETVWKVSPQGEVEIFADTLYGASGNAIDADGSLLQASFHAGTLTRIARDGTATLVASGLQGPVGVAIGDEGNTFVCNCRSNEIVRVDTEGSVHPFADGDLFNCPNGITRDPDGNLYVVNFCDARAIRITPDGEASLLATLPGGGNGHITWVGPDLYATAFRANRVVRIQLDGAVATVGGTGAFGQVDADDGTVAQFATPNGIAYNRSRNELYTNDYLNPWGERFSGRFDPKSSLRVLAFPTLQETFDDHLASSGLDAAVAAVQAFMARRPGGRYEVILNAFGYSKLGAGDLPGALAVLEMNTRLFPDSFNVWDSFGEAQVAAGNPEAAIRYYRKSLELNPDNRNAATALETLQGGQ